MTTPLRLIVLLACVLLPAGAWCFQEKGASPAKIGQLAWLQGTWFSDDGSEIVEEQWLKPRGGMMLGVNRTVPAKGAAKFEFMRLAETPEGLTFFASPGGKPATPFPAVEVGENRVVFENPKNDFPTRILYRREGDLLHGAIEGNFQGKNLKMEWKWRLDK